MPFNLCLGRRRRGPAGRQFLPPEVIEELARVGV